ncbi:MAG: SPW repeat protein [Actinomycetes bacterium]
MKRWAHPQDFVALAAGVYAVLSPIWTTTTNKATTTMIVLGVVTAGLALLSLARPGKVADGLMALMGALFIISPWVMNFDGTRPMAWTAWIVGALTVLVGVSDITMTRAAQHGGGLAASH